jgi:hypothetical protein
MLPMTRYLAMLAILTAPAAVQAGAKTAAKLRSPVGTVLQWGGDKGWLAPVLYDAIPAGAQLVALPGARGLLDVKEGDVRLVLAGNLPEFSATPVLESVVRLAAPTAEFDLEFTFERGRVLIENHKESGAATYRARIWTSICSPKKQSSRWSYSAAGRREPRFSRSPRPITSPSAS